MAVTNKFIIPGSISISFSIDGFPATFPATADVSYSITDLDDNGYNKNGYLRYQIMTGSATVDEVAIAIGRAIINKEEIKSNQNK